MTVELHLLTVQGFTPSKYNVEATSVLVAGRE